MKSAILIMFFKIIFELSASSPNFKKVYLRLPVGTAAPISGSGTTRYSLFIRPLD